MVKKTGVVLAGFIAIATSWLWWEWDHIAVDRQCASVGAAGGAGARRARRVTDTLCRSCSAASSLVRRSACAYGFLHGCQIEGYVGNA